MGSDSMHQSKPNIVFLTVGCSNSTVITRMLEAMGWNLGRVRPVFAEHQGIHNINRIAAWKKGLFNVQQAKAIIDGLPQPWVVKDPKFCETLKHWQPLFAPYQPLLLWVTKNLDYVEKSYARRFPGEFKPGYVRTRTKWCETYFQNWPWAKFTIDVDQIAAAVRLFQPDRTYSGGEVPTLSDANKTDPSELPH